ncbi:MAG: hypothetical protein ACTSR8_20905 [Promethearchaeota archaeon]
MINLSNDFLEQNEEILWNGIPSPRIIIKYKKIINLRCLTLILPLISQIFIAIIIFKLTTIGYGFIGYIFFSYVIISYVLAFSLPFILRKSDDLSYFNNRQYFLTNKRIIDFKEVQIDKSTYYSIRNLELNDIDLVKIIPTKKVDLYHIDFNSNKIIQNFNEFSYWQEVQNGNYKKNIKKEPLLSYPKKLKKLGIFRFFFIEQIEEVRQILTRLFPNKLNDDTF